MTFIPELGLDIRPIVLESALVKHKACQVKCQQTHHTDAEACVKKFGESTNVVAGLACVADVAIAGTLCADRCELEFFLDVAFNGQPADDKDPDGFFKNEIKPFFPNTRKVLITAGLLAGAYGGATMRKAGTLNAVMRSRGQFILITGAVLFGVERFMKEVLDDPPDDDFENIFFARQLSGSAMVRPLGVDPNAEILFLPYLAATLQVMTTMEGIAVSLDRAAAAKAAGRQDLHLAQMRVSQRYAKACAGSLKRAQEARLSVADKLETLALTEGTSAQDLIVTLEEAVALQQSWKQGEFDEGVAKVIEQIARDQDEAEAIIDDFANRKLPAAQFGRSLPEILKTKQLATAEIKLIQGLAKWEGFYRQ